MSHPLTIPVPLTLSPSLECSLRHRHTQHARESPSHYPCTPHPLTLTGAQPAPLSCYHPLTLTIPVTLSPSLNRLFLPVTLPVNLSPFLSTCHPPCQPVTLPVNLSPFLSTCHPPCQPVTLPVNLSPSLSTCHPPCQPVTLLFSLPSMSPCQRRTVFVATCRPYLMTLSV